MKMWLLVVPFLASALIGCETDRPLSAAEQSQRELYLLAQRNGCIDCHRIKATVVGPSWQAIADRYKDAPKEEARAILIRSVREGSVGNYATWKGGQGMPPMEKRVAAETIERLVDYILNLNQ